MADVVWLKGHQFFDSSGNPLNGGLIRTYDAGTTNARTVYKDADAGVPWTQPIELDSTGRLTASVYVPTGDWKFTLSTAGEVVLVTEDDIPGAVTIPSSTFAQIELPVITKTDDYTITTSDLGKMVKSNTTGGDVQLTLPTALSAGDGAAIFVQHVVAANVTTVVPTGSDTLNGGSSLRLFRRWASLVLVSDGGTAWTAMSADFYFATTAKTTTYTVLPSDVGKLLTGDATGGAFTITLPPAATAGDGFEVAFLKIDSTSAAITIDGDGSETINGASSISLGVQWQAARLRCNGSAWYIVSGNESGKQSIWVPAAAMVSRVTNGAALGIAETTTNDLMLVTKDFDASTSEGAQFSIRFPKGWNLGTVTAIPYWSHPSTTTNFGVVWAVQAVAIGDDDALDAAFGTEQTSADTGGTTDDLYIGPETSAITIGGTPALGDLVVFQVKRNVSDGSDTMAVDARLHGILILYTATSFRDD